MNEPLQAQKRIAIIDSGSGGTTILHALKEKILNVDFFYTSDLQNFPYGTKSDDEVIGLANALALKAVQDSRPDILVLACNTASTVALEAIRQNLKIPVVGVVPAIKLAAKLSRTKIIGLLATPGTINRPYTEKLIKEFASDCVVKKLASQSLVAMAEEKARGKYIHISDVEMEIKPLFCKNLDTIVLGCTHFPLLISELKDASPWQVTWVDSSEAIVRRVEFLLNN